MAMTSAPAMIQAIGSRRQRQTPTAAARTRRAARIGASVQKA